MITADSATILAHALAEPPADNTTPRGSKDKCDCVVPVCLGRTVVVRIDSGNISRHICRGAHWRFQTV